MSRTRTRWTLFLVVAVASVASFIAVSAPVEAGPPINCRFVLCAYPDCGPGYHTEIPPGQCCPVCVAD